MTVDDLQFGLFMPPFHNARQNPTLSLERDVQLIQFAEEVGFDEVWVGEHHSAGWELVGSPEVFLSHVAARTSRIRLGTGMISLPYHNPLWAAERVVLLDHLSRGRAMFGVGPGSLPSDAEMIGLDSGALRPMLEEAVGTIVRLLRTDDPVTIETEWFKLKDARLQLRPYSRDLELAVAALMSPVGPRVAGKNGISLLSIGATDKRGFDVLGKHWGVLEEEAAHYGTVADRSRWRLVGPMHVRETVGQARDDVATGLKEWFDQVTKVQAVPQFAAMLHDDIDDLVSFFIDGGSAVVGTADDACEQIQRLSNQSGGFGCYLIMCNNWAAPQATRQSLSLIAQDVFPHFQGSNKGLIAAEEHARRRHDDLYQQQEVALIEMQKRHEAERAAR